MTLSLLLGPYHVIPSHTYILSDSQKVLMYQSTNYSTYHSLRVPHTGTRHRYSRPSQTETFRESTIAQHEGQGVRMLSSSAKQALRKLKSAGF